MSRMRGAGWLLGIMAASCGEDATGPSRGSLEVTSITIGAPTDPDGYTLTLDREARPIGANARLTLADVPPGEHELELGGIASNCALAGPNPRTVTVAAGAIARITLEIACGAPDGAVAVTTSTTGKNPDPNGYTVALDGGTGRPIGTSATITFTGVAAGEHAVRLSGVAPNCSVAAENPRAITMPNGGTVQVAFQVGCLSPGSGALLFASDRTGTAHLYRMRPDGTEILDLTPSSEVFDGDWSPDGSRIAFSSTQDEGLRIFTMNADGSDPVGLGMAGGDPRWSPDGRKIVFSDGTIRVMNADGSALVSLTTGGSPDWSPDGSRIAFHRVDRSQCLAVLNFCQADIYVMAADGSQLERLTSASNSSDQSTAPAWSPDGRSIAYARRCCFLGPNLSGVWVISPLGGAPRRIDTRAAAGRPVWSPDGSEIAFGAVQVDGSAELTVIPSAGGVGVVLASSPGVEYPTSWR